MRAVKGHKAAMSGVVGVRWRKMAGPAAFAVAVFMAVSCRRERQVIEPVAEAGSSDDARLALVAENQWIVPGRPFTLGLDLTIPRGWHTYWENPGDTGMAPEFRWTMPDGVRLVGVRFPVPARFEDYDIVSFGYEGTVRLLADFEADAPLDARSGQIRVEAVWMICRDVCLPVVSSAAVDVKIDAAHPAAAVDAEEAGFARCRERMPRHTDGWEVSATDAGKNLRVRVRPPADIGEERLWTGARIFPKRAGVLDLNASASWQRSGDDWIADLPAGPSALAVGDMFEAVLALEGPDGPFGWRLGVKVEAEQGPE